MIYYKTSEEIELIRESCLLVSKTLAFVGRQLRPGVNVKDIDKSAEELIRDNGGVPGFLGYNGFPATLCVSFNEAVVHGIPGDVEVKDGDIISVDCGVKMNEFFGDSAFTFAVGDVEEEIMELLSVTNESLYLGIDMAKAGNRLGDIGYAIQAFAEKEHGYGIVRELVGHGLGKNLHEPPEVPNYGQRGKGIKLKEGLVLAIEPMINLGKKEIRQLDDGWTIVTRDKKPSAHYEHTVVIKQGVADVLSSHKGVEEAVKNNPDLKEISKKR